jgi:hypothetical protein
MSQVISPPSIYFNGINFNSEFYAQDTAGVGITTSQANALYLRKTVNDTATALETFTQGIATNTVSKYGTGEQKIFADDTNSITSNYGELNAVATFGPQARAVRLGTGATLNVDIGKNMTATSGNYIGIGSGTSQLTNIGIGVRAGTDILSGTGKIVIGGTGNDTSLLSDSTTITSLKTNTIAPTISTGSISIASASGAITIGTSQVGGNTLQVGSGSSSVSIPGGSTIGSITTNTINSTSTLNSLNINGGINSSLNLGTLGNRSTNVNIGTGNTASGQVNIQTGGNATGDVSIMSGGSQSGNLNLGNSTNTVAININRPLVLGYAPSALMSSNMLGHTTTDTITLTGTIPSATLSSLFSDLTLPVGVWLITYSVRYRSAGTSTITAYYIWGQDSITVQNPPKAVNATNTTFITSVDGFANTGTFVVSSTGTTTYVVRIYMAYSGSDMRIDLGTPDFGSVITRTRIA